jgi:hypothetical protein
MRMLCHLPTKNLFYSLFCFGLLCFGLLSANGVAFAQVYKSYDADGNVVFSDKPSKRGKEVEVSEPNVSESFEMPPQSPTKSTSKTKTEREQVMQPIADYDPADTNKDGRVSRREKEEQREERHKQNREAAEATEGDEE